MTEISEAEFDRLYNDIKERNVAHDREQAILFVDSGWSQQRIAEHLGMTQQWVGQQLRFGRFFEFTTAVVNFEALTERAFRKHWEATDRSLPEEARFRAVCVALGFKPPAPKIAPPENIDARMKAVAANVGINLTNSANCTKLKTVLTQGHARVIAFVEKGELGLESGYLCAKHMSHQEQEMATLPYLRKARGRYWGTEKQKPAKEKPTTAVVNKPPAPRLAFSKLDIGAERIDGQPVLLYPAYVQRLYFHRTALGTAVQRILSFANSIDSSLIEAVTAMRAHVPIPGKTNGEEHDFAADAKDQLKIIEEYVQKAIEYLVEVRGVMARDKQSTMGLARESEQAAE